jgi:hypothetical protein
MSSWITASQFSNIRFLIPVSPDEAEQGQSTVPRMVGEAARLCMPGQRIFTYEPGYWYTFFISTSPRGLRGPSKPAGDIGDKLGSGMPAANADGPNLQRTIPPVRSKTD